MCFKELNLRVHIWRKAVWSQYKLNLFHELIENQFFLKDINFTITLLNYLFEYKWHLSCLFVFFTPLEEAFIEKILIKYIKVTVCRPVKSLYNNKCCIFYQMVMPQTQSKSHLSGLSWACMLLVLGQSSICYPP